MLIHSPALQSNSSLRLENLPVDILIQIQKHLDAKDIIALRKSCRGLHAITQQRTVWLNALRRMCRRHGVFAPSFPLQDMSITQLEHASLSPSRVSSLVHNNIPLRSFVTRILDPCTPQIFLDQLGCMGAFLVPGGRFLVANYLSHGICLWDLGMHAGEVPKLMPLAIIPDVKSRSLCTGPTQDGLGIIIISNPILRSDRTIFAHEIYPCTSNPHFILVGSIKYPEQTSYVHRRPALSGDLLVFNTDPVIVVWNVRLGTATAWKCSEHIRDILISGDSVVLVHTFGLSVWDIPPLHPLSEASYKIVDNAPKYEIIHSPDLSSASSVLGPWFSGINPPISLVTFGPKDEKSDMTCYTLKSISPSKDPTLPAVLPVKMGTVLDLPSEAKDGSNISFSGSLQYCEDELCHISLSRDTALISLVMPPTLLNGPSSAITAELFDFQTDTYSSSFCAVSGRFVVVEAEGGICIIDFLAPSPA